MRFRPALLLFLVSLTAMAQTTSPNAPGMSTFHDDTLHLSYTYPSSFVDASAMVTPALEASVGHDPNAAAEARCISLPFSRMASERDKVSMVILLRADASCLKRKFDAKSVTDLTKGEAQGLSAIGAKPSFGPPVSFQVANRPAAVLQGSFTLPTGQAMQAMVVCVLDQPDIACWQFLANNAASLSTMSSLPVTFDGSPATPLVPAAVLGKGQ